ncbi:hypothetical protein [Leptothoe spongobia]|uniref:Tetratricopeptide repeat protein n=1 Tax=Leptothoe spongobia TAU-MAC 1115 TaxID=1967444 RepID=A0A947DFW2_9CYAN|nr:hypothetical protein [Leptothoe spongobia]MBT9316005.1 hypothetical protein [Leptothoe spongobia TAU-MAC 1115]
MKKHRWLDLTEYALLVGSGAGTVASVATQQVLLAAAPLSLLAGLGLLNRRQLQAKLSESQSVMLSVNSKLDERLHDVKEQIDDLPSHEQLSAVRQSIVAQNQQDILSLTQVFEYTRKTLTEKIEAQEIPEIKQLRQELVDLQDQHTRLCIALKDVRSRCQQLSDTSRLETIESVLTKLKAELMQQRVHIEVLGADTKNNHAGLNDKLHYIEQRVQQLTTEERQSLLREEVQELVKTVSDMVSRNEFLELAANVKEKISPQETILQLAPSFDPDEVDQLQQRIELLEQQLGKVTESVLDAVAETLEPLDKGMASMDRLKQRLDATDQQMSTMTNVVLEAVAETLEPLQAALANSADSQWVLDFANVEGKSNSRKALEELLAQARDRMVLVWPWSDNVHLDADLLEQFHQLLARNCRLSIGWCHRGDNREHPLLRNISQRWSESSTRHRQLKQALKQLLPLKQAYPNLFSFKILGTTENFAVCDSKSALIGMQNLATQTSLFPTVKLRLRTTDSAVIHPLIHRFENPTIGNEDAGSYFNRGITRYDMRNYAGAVDDFTQVISIRPSAAAYNCRGVAWAEMSDYADALRDFGHALRLDTRLFAARCNRGALRLNVRDYAGAISDLETAVEIRPESAIPYFYLGQALQALGELRQAVEKFGLAIERQPNLALPYCYRGAVYQKQGNLRQAIADLEVAAQLLRTSGDANNLNQVMRKLETLKQRLPVKTTVLL